MLDGKESHRSYSSSEASGDNCGENCRCSFFLETLSPTQGMLLAVYLANLMSEGLNSDQINILGNFVTTIGDLILYRAAIIQTDDDSATD